MQSSRAVKSLGVLALALALAMTANLALADNIRPISDWLSAQGTRSTFIPPDPDFLGWSVTPPPSIQYFASIDYAGLANAYPTAIKPELSGIVTEHPLVDGRAEVAVMLETKNANAWVMYLDWLGSGDQFLNNPTIFGHRPADVLLGAEQALASCFLDLRFINSALGAPLPDLVELVGNYDPYVPLSDYIYYVFSAQAHSSLGNLSVLQEGIWNGSAWRYPVERIVLPLPATLLLFGSGLLGLLGIRSSRRK